MFACYQFSMACIQYVVMIHLSDLGRLIELETEHVYTLCKISTGNSQTSRIAYLFTKINEIYLFIHLMKPMFFVLKYLIESTPYMFWLRNKKKKN